MEISVLITCHNRKAKTLACLKSLYAQEEIEGINFNVFLVDDGCTDGTASAVENYFPSVNILVGDGSLFWNRGMCKAWEAARNAGPCDGVIWLNDDTMLNDSALRLIFEMARDNNDAIIVGTISSSDNHDIITYGGYKEHRLVDTRLGDSRCDTFNGNCVFIPKTVSDSIGYLDPYYVHSVGDFDYSWRAVKNGIKCLVTPIIGTCDRNPPEPKWNNGSLIERFKKLYSPTGNNPREVFHFYKKQSYIKAIFMYIYIHIRVLLTFVLPKKTF